jgi:hypothetical protein
MPLQRRPDIAQSTIEDGNDRVELGRIQHDQQKVQQNLKKKEKQCQASCCHCQDNYVGLNRGIKWQNQSDILSIQLEATVKGRETIIPTLKSARKSTR